MIKQSARLSRRTLLRFAVVGGSGILAAYFVGCSDEDESASSPATTPPSQPTPAPGGTQGQVKKLISGWYRNREAKYYDFGTNTPLFGGGVPAVPLYLFVRGVNPDGTPVVFEGQHNIVDVLPGDAGYSDLWQVMMVTVPEDYSPDSIKSKNEVDDSGFEVSATETFVNCPIVPEGTSLEGGEELVQGWYRGRRVFYPDFGPNNSSAIPIWLFVAGTDDQGNPRFLEGQNNIIDAVPEDPGYSAFWRVNLVAAPTDYQPNGVRSAAAVIASGFTITETDMVVNCPVTSVSPA